MFWSKLDRILDIVRDEVDSQHVIFSNLFNHATTTCVKISLPFDSSDILHDSATRVHDMQRQEFTENYNILDDPDEWVFI